MSFMMTMTAFLKFDSQIIIPGNKFLQWYPWGQKRGMATEIHHMLPFFIFANFYLVGYIQWWWRPYWHLVHKQLLRMIHFGFNEVLGCEKPYFLSMPILWFCERWTIAMAAILDFAQKNMRFIGTFFLDICKLFWAIGQKNQLWHPNV